MKACTLFSSNNEVAEDWLLKFNSREPLDICGQKYLIDEISTDYEHGFAGVTIKMYPVYQAKSHKTPKKQEAWDGEGLPQVGTECEWKEKSGFQWVAATILFITESSVVCKRSDGFEWQMPTKRTVFRPIKTAEQLAEEERDKARTEVLNAMTSKTMGFETEDQWQQRMKVVGEMLDMGYRKQ